MDLSCPKCRSLMEPVNFQGTEVDRCTACKGIWFDLLEHRRLAQIQGSEVIDVGTPLPREQRDAPATLECPKCKGSRLIRIVDTDQRHVWVESCPVCHGVFLDAGEFRDLKEKTVFDFFRNLFDRERK